MDLKSIHPTTESIEQIRTEQNLFYQQNATSAKDKAAEFFS